MGKKRNRNGHPKQQQQQQQQQPQAKQQWQIKPIEQKEQQEDRQHGEWKVGKQVTTTTTTIQNSEVGNSQKQLATSSQHRRNYHRGDAAIAVSATAGHPQLPLPFPAHLPVPTNEFLRNEPPYQDSFQAALQTAYEGFEVDFNPLRSFSSSQKQEQQQQTKQSNSSNTNFPFVSESSVQQALLQMEREGYFRTDVTQPFGLGTKCAKTYVTRCLVGEPGTTYKYLGLRMFASSWLSHDNGAATATDHHHHNNNNNNKKKDRNNKKKKRKRNEPKVDDDEEEESTSTNSPLHVIYQLKEALRERTRHYLTKLQQRRRQRQSASSLVRTAVGRAEFDICLINRMEYSPSLKMEPSLQQHRCAVSWHADSSLEHYSTIAVYQTLTDPNITTTLALPGANAQERKKKYKKQKFETKHIQSHDNGDKSHAEGDYRSDHVTRDGGGWTVALRVSHHAEGPDASNKRVGAGEGEKEVDVLVKKANKKPAACTATAITTTTAPPIAVSLPSGSAYYLLDDFNHHHQHTVLTEDPAHLPEVETAPIVRFSCTYRLLRTSHNVSHLLERCQRSCTNFHKKGVKMWRSEQLLLTEMESEWIRQFYVQGQGHLELLWKDWKDPMHCLLRYWSQLETRTKQTIDLLTSGAEGRCQVEESKLGSSCNSKSQRKLRDKRKKAYHTLQDLLFRTSDESSTSTKPKNTTNDNHSPALHLMLYQPFALLLEERATMRELWALRENDHVFQELSPEFRPLELPLEFGVDVSSSTNVKTLERDCECQGRSPLQGTPADLRRYASILRACGQAFSSGLAKDLPAELLDARSEQDESTKNIHTHNVASDHGEEDDPHSKRLDWNGWQHYQFALEMQSPWANLLLEGKKTIETRAYSLPPALLGKKIWILRSPKGSDGVSSLPNRIELKHQLTNDSDNNDRDHVRIIGWCKFSSVKSYSQPEEFAKDESGHLVPNTGGRYGWVDGKTHLLYGWVVEEYGSLQDRSSGGELQFPSTATRRLRSLFELQHLEGRHYEVEVAATVIKRTKKRKRF